MKVTRKTKVKTKSNIYCKIATKKDSFMIHLNKTDIKFVKLNLRLKLTFKKILLLKLGYQSEITQASESHSEMAAGVDYENLETEK